jgi:PhzF family phenazine biosynthesis protein
MEKKIYLVKAFTKKKEQGNSAGVLLDANGLTDTQMIKIAAELGFSESAFVQDSESADVKVRFFTPLQEVDLCGHGTIATFHTLLEAGVIDLQDKKSITVVQESKAGLLPVTINADGLIVMTQANLTFIEPIADRKNVAELLGITEKDLLHYPIQAVSTGTPKLMIPVVSRKVLFAIKPDLQGIADFCRQNNIKGFYPFTLDTIDNDADFHARQFNPLAGVNEDPITGVAAGALGAYAVKYTLLSKNKFVVEQGYIMNQPGTIYLEVGDEVTVGGYAVTFGSKTVTV